MGADLDVQNKVFALFYVFILESRLLWCNFKFQEEKTALFEAAFIFRAKIVEFLLAEGANPIIPNKVNNFDCFFLNDH